jgi:uncharacterized membrane protein YqjE
MASVDSQPGVLHSVRGLVETMADMARSRLELASIELGETLERLLTSLIVAFMAVLLIAASLMALSALIVFAVDEEHRALVLAAMGAIYLLVGVGMLVWLRNYLQSWPGFLSATLEELRQDSQVLRGEPPRPGERPPSPAGRQDAGAMGNSRTGGGAMDSSRTGGGAMDSSRTGGGATDNSRTGGG